MSRPLQTRLENVDVTEAQILDGATVTTSELNILDGVTATADEINANCDRSGRLVASGVASVSLLNTIHNDRILYYSKADGGAITLPAASGLGSIYTVILGATITSNSTTIKAASASDSFTGMAFGVDVDGEGATGYTWNADSGDDTVTLNGGSTGGFIGDEWVFKDVASGVWQVRGFITQSGGSEATPFSATVS